LFFNGPPEYYRIKPEPEVIWAVLDSSGVMHGSFFAQENANKLAMSYPLSHVSKFVEVL
jgi:hypothetical protein